MSFIEEDHVVYNYLSAHACESFRLLRLLPLRRVQRTADRPGAARPRAARRGADRRRR